MRKSPKYHKFVPVFVGGTGRSGTTVMGDLLGSHPNIRTSTPTEIKFLSNRLGLLDVVFGRDEDIQRSREKISIFHFRTFRKRRDRDRKRREQIWQEFESAIWSKWWDIDAPPPHGRGLVSGISRANLEKLLRSLQWQLKINRVWAGRRFMTRFIALQDQAGDEKFWVETTPMNIPASDKLLRLFPNALFITMTRDPRDVIASLLTKNWGPTSPIEGLTWIEKRLSDGHTALKKVPAGQKISISLEELAIHGREDNYQKVLDFLDIHDAPAMRHFFEAELTPEKATSGRWKEEISSPEFNESFAKIETLLVKLSGL